MRGPVSLARRIALTAAFAGTAGLGVGACTSSSNHSCPAELPWSGSACAPEGAYCGYETQTNSCGADNCYCKGGAWTCEPTCITTPMPPRDAGASDGSCDAQAPCPQQPPLDAGACPTNGIECGYAISSSPCGAVDCNCVNDAWACAPSCALDAATD